MPLPSQPVTLTVEQLTELNGKLATMRHDLNNKLCVIAGAVEVIRIKPQSAQRMLETLLEQSAGMAAAIKKYSDEFDRAFGITRP